MTYFERFYKRPESYFKGMFARTNDELRNGLVSIPSGTLVKITRKFSGFNIETKPCANCGIRLFITKVDPSFLELTDQKF